MFRSCDWTTKRAGRRPTRRSAGQRFSVLVNININNNNRTRMKELTSHRSPMEKWILSSIQGKMIARSKFARQDLLGLYRDINALFRMQQIINLEIPEARFLNILGKS